MLTHIVCWKYKAEATDAEKAAHVEKLRALPGVIPNILSFSVGRDVLHLERSFDTGLVATYPDRAALDFYTDHPVHQEAAAFGRQIAEKVISVDFTDD
ncbi:MAG: Dabb family protein [Acidobacteria bacterium]|nr:Dabb family protein [Acidobacteriota bacterium]